MVFSNLLVLFLNNLGVHGIEWPRVITVIDVSLRCIWWLRLVDSMTMTIYRAHFAKFRRTDVRTSETYQRQSYSSLCVREVPVLGPWRDVPIKTDYRTSS